MLSIQSMAGFENFRPEETGSAMTLTNFALWAIGFFYCNTTSNLVINHVDNARALMTSDFNI